MNKLAFNYHLKSAHAGVFTVQYSNNIPYSSRFFELPPPYPYQ